MTTEAENGVKSVLISEEEIHGQVSAYGKFISREYRGKKLLLVGVLKGGFIFASDLFREIEIPCEIDFVETSSYGSDMVSSGKVILKKDISTDISGYDVIIAEDIIDTGITMSKLKELFQLRNPKSLKIIALLDKPDRRTVDFEPDYALFTIPDKFVVGYGLDYAQKYRNLKYIGEL